MKYKYILVLVGVLLIFSSVIASNAQATVGGPTFIYDFKYNPQDESVYYKKISESGRGCPPELMKLSLVSGGPETVYSCDDGEKLIQNGGNFSDVNLAIDNIILNFKDLTAINLKDNGIFIDVNFIDYKKFGFDPNDIELANFKAEVYQNNIKLIDFPVTGCNLKQPFTFMGYVIPGFDKKIALLLSTKGDCMEGGYIAETLHIVGGLENLNKIGIPNYYKNASALILNEGVLVVYESDRLSDNAVNVTPKNLYVYLTVIGIFVIIIVFLIGLVIKKKIK